MSVILGGFAAFFGGIVLVLGLVVLWLCGLASALCLMVSVFAGVMYWITGTPHDGELAVGYLVYAAVPFVATVVLSYYGNKFTGGPPAEAGPSHYRRIAAGAGCGLHAQRRLPLDGIALCHGVMTIFTSSRRRVSPPHCYVAMPILPSNSMRLSDPQ